MSLFGNIDVSATGIGAAQTWLNTIAGNIANMNDVGPVNAAVYGQQAPVFTPTVSFDQVGDGVAVAAIAVGDTTGIIQSDPSSPVANAQGLVRVPDVQLGSQMVDMIQAQTDFQANTSALASAKTAYQSALTLGT